MDLGAAHIIQGNALNLPLADSSVDLICTSPPYFGLRSYQDGGQHYDGQIGSEATPQEFLDALMAATREMVRVLKPTGSIFVNLGDKYASNPSWGRGQSTLGGRPQNAIPRGPAGNGVDYSGMRPKTLMGIPWRYAIRCIDELGLILRAEIIWSKPNGLPESVTDRVRRSHEQWFHLVKQPRYFAAVDEIREPQASHRTGKHSPKAEDFHTDQMSRKWNPTEYNFNPLGKLPGSVWTIAYNEEQNLVRSILDAVAEGALTPQEGERLWLGRTDYGTKSTPVISTTAGAGWAVSTATATDDTGKAQKATDEHTDSSTNSPLNPSLMDSPSTTSVATDGASTPGTWSQSPSKSTYPDGPAAHTVQRGMNTTQSTRTSEPTANENAANAWPTERADREQPNGPPSVWEVPTQPLTVPADLGIDHFAAYPMEWPRRIIQGWTPNGICTECGEGRRPISDKRYLSGSIGYDSTGRWGLKGQTEDTPLPTRLGDGSQVTIIGYVCGCNTRAPNVNDEGPKRESLSTPTAPTIPAVVLDPFGGTGTTALVAKALGRIGITIDLSSDYCRLAEWRTNNPRELAAALQIEKPEPVHADQMELF